MNTTHSLHLHPGDFIVKLINVNTGWAVMLLPPGAKGPEFDLFIEDRTQAHAVAIALAAVAQCNLLDPDWRAA